MFKRKTRVMLGGRKHVVEPMLLEAGLEFVCLCKELMEELQTSETPLQPKYFPRILEEYPGKFTKLISLLTDKPNTWIVRHCTAIEVLEAFPSLLVLNGVASLIEGARFLGILPEVEDA